MKGSTWSEKFSAVDNQHLGDTVLIWDGAAACWICCLPRRSRNRSRQRELLYQIWRRAERSQCSTGISPIARCGREFGRARDAKTLSAGVNLARLDAYREMLEAGFRATSQGVAMEGNGAVGYNRPDVFLMDDWR